MLLSPFTLPSLVLFLLCAGTSNRSLVLAQDNECPLCTQKIEFDSRRHQSKYFIGVLANRGKDVGYWQYGPTFTEYLTLTAGKRFEPPIEFEMSAVDFQEMYDFTGNRQIDFTFVNPSASVCIMAEYNTQPLLSLSKRIVAEGATHEVSEFAGLIITRADNNDINTIDDLNERVVGVVSIGSFGGGLLQFHEMFKAGMSFINDPKAIVFTENQFAVIQGVLDGVFDAGFVRTGMIQQMQDSEGTLIDPSTLKVLQSKQSTTSEGNAFPYEHTTSLAPEWQFAALDHVASEVSEEVQAALYALDQHAQTGQALQDCEQSQTDTNCSDVFEVDPESRRDTTLAIANTSFDALLNGGYAGFRPTLSYGNVRGLLQDTGFITKNSERNVWTCSRPADLYDTIACPEGYFLQSKEDFDEACANLGVDCPEGYHCACKPCFKATDLEVVLAGTYTPGGGCEKMSICGSIEKSQRAVYQIVDHKDRKGLDMYVSVHEGSVKRTVNVFPGATPNVYEFTLSSDRLGTLIFEIFLGDEQIAASPLRVEIVPPECEGSLVPNEEGDCKCPVYTLAMGGKCFDQSKFFLSLFLPLTAIAVFAVMLHLRKRRFDADRLWKIDEDELHFEESPRIIGEGAAGIAVLGEYRGAMVAVKKPFPSQTGTHKDSLKMTPDMRDEGGDQEEVNVSSTTQATSHDIEAPVSEDDPFKTSRVGPSNSSAGWFGASRSSMISSNPLKGDFVAEIRVLTQLRHPNITTLMGAVLPKKGPPMFVFEYMEHGSLYEVLHNPTIELEAATTLQILRDISKGLRFLHSWRPAIIHGDMKSPNILIDSTFRAKLTDIVLTKAANRAQASGTTLWMAPELLSGTAVNTKASDMYSVGVIFCEVFSGKEPFEEAHVNENELINDICDETISRRPTIPQWCPPEARVLIEELWHHDPSSRPTVEQLDSRLAGFDATKIHPEYKKSTKKVAERAHTNDFIYQAFPSHVADILQAGGKMEPEAHPLVTIVFSDIVGFTTIASKLSPLKVSSLLDRLYLQFDEIARKHELFKIETIGDAYMAAANLVKDQSDDHVKRIAYFAQDLIQAAGETLLDEGDPDQGSVAVRVGFHSGPVVSNVVGSLNPRYGLFGDTVNVASRMESTSETGRIHCSKESAKLLMSQAPEVPLREHGKIPIKGRGTMSTYWVS